MRRRITGRRLALLALSVAMLTGCDTRRAILGDRGVWVRLEADWQQADIRPEGTSFYVFSRQSGARTELLLTNDLNNGVTLDSLRLYVGAYSLLVMNETENSHDNLAFRGMGNYASAEACVSPLELPADSRYAQDAATRAPTSVNTMTSATEVLAADHIDGFEANYEMALDGARPLLQMVPQRLSLLMDVIIHVRNINSLSSGRQQLCALYNMAEGVFLASGNTNTTPATHWFAVTSTITEPETNSGTLQASFALFGALRDKTNPLVMYFQLRDGQECTFERDVTTQLNQSHLAGEVHLTLEIGLGLSEGDDPIELPETVPVSDDFFDVSVGGWDNSSPDIDIPI